MSLYFYYLALILNSHIFLNLLSHSTETVNITLHVANYMARYAPSEKKLISYLEKKKYSGNIPDFLREIGYSEDMMCDMWIRSFLSSGKGEKEMKLKLMKKEFPKEKIIEKIEGIQEEIRNWKYHEKIIEKQIQDLLEKGKSKMMIGVILCGKYPYFRDEIKEILGASSDASGLEKEITKYRNKYNLSNPEEKQKVVNNLLRKGFRWEDIKNIGKETAS